MASGKWGGETACEESGEEDEGGVHGEIVVSG